MADSGKRKATHGADGDGSLRKKKKGNSGKWKVTRSEDSGKPKSNTIEPGDVGIWVTCPLHMKGKSAREMELLFDEYADKLYGIKTEDGPADDSEDEGDIEAAIQKELGSLKDKRKQSSDDKGVFSEVRINQECLLFMKCKAPVEPVEFSRRICQDAVTGSHGARARYLNRLTPVTVITKASENGLEEATRKALAGHLKLQPREAATDGDSAEKGGKTEGGEETSKPFTFAIRPSIRNHNTLQRDDVIKRIATLVDPQHKVNLGAPDKVILVDIYQTICGMSVVPGDWDALKKYNLTELYKQANMGKTEPENNNGKTEPQSNKSKPATESKGASCSS